MTSLFAYYQKLGTADFLRKVLYTIRQKCKWGLIRKIRAYFYLKSSSVVLGKNVRIIGLPHKIHIGVKTIFYDNCILEFGQDSDLTIGSQVIFSYGVVLSCRSKIVIGNDVQIGEYSSVRDSTHRYDEMDKPMKYAEDISLPVIVKNNVWIGRGCVILPGTTIEEGVVVAANSVVKGRLEKNGIYGGAPAKFIKYRTAQ